jgi:hypothetical protein
MTPYNLVARRKMGSGLIENESSVKLEKENISEIRVPTLQETLAGK